MLKYAKYQMCGKGIYIDEIHFNTFKYMCYNQHPYITFRSIKQKKGETIYKCSATHLLFSRIASLVGCVQLFQGQQKSKKIYSCRALTQEVVARTLIPRPF